MFGKDIIGWTLIEDDESRPRMVQEIHVLKGGGLLVGPKIARWKWERAQRRMWPSYPAALWVPIEMVPGMLAQEAA